MIAVLKNQLVELARTQHERLRNMAARLSAHTTLNKYVAPDPPDWRPYDDAADFAFGNAYRAALTVGDPAGTAHADVTRTRQPAGDLLAGLTPASRETLERALATLDAADSALILGTHQAGLLRSNGPFEASAIDALESHVIDPSADQSATAVLDKISGAVLLETRQKQARLQYLTAIVEQLIIDNKRSRDTETAALNMRLRQLQATSDNEGESFVAGASDDLRNWRQP
ncbi:MAG: hypothetical protein AB7L71_00320 [Vicinamibacterales bacterium]